MKQDVILPRLGVKVGSLVLEKLNQDELNWLEKQRISGGPAKRLRWKTSTMFLEHIDSLFNPDPKTGCFEWIGRTDGGGYGQIKWLRRYYLVHRMVLEMVHNVILDARQYGCHHCDNRKCINPIHLYIGSALTNNQDTVIRGRHIPGMWAKRTEPVGVYPT